MLNTYFASDTVNYVCVLYVSSIPLIILIKKNLLQPNEALIMSVIFILASIVLLI